VPPAVAIWSGTPYTAAARNGVDYLLVRTHARWDSGNYQNISRHGYQLLHCIPKPASPFAAADWCRTVAWFPLYPLGMRLAITVLEPSTRSLNAAFDTRD
jgi:hypothetical protein